MRLLLNTHVILALLRRELIEKHAKLEGILAPANRSFASAASLWEIAIKTRIGKLDPGMPLEEIGGFLEQADVPVIPVNRHHAVTIVEPKPDTRDPFDRMLLAQCKVEDLRLVTLDRALVNHPLAWQA